MIPRGLPRGNSFSLLEVQVPRLILEEDTDYVWQARFFNNRDTASEWSFQGTFATDYAEYADRDRRKGKIEIRRWAKSPSDFLLGGNCCYGLGQSTP